MKGLWSDKEAREHASELGLRVYTSRLLGREPSLVLHGGGNTSVKVKERNAGPDAAGASRFPLRSEEFILRPLVTAAETFWETPILIEAGCHGRNIVRYRGRFYGARDEDLGRLADRELAQLPFAREIQPLKRELALMASPTGRLAQKMLRLARLLGVR